MPNKVTKEQIQQIMDNSQYEVFHRIFDKQCLVVAKLPNGFTVVGELACVDPSIYDEEIGVKLAKQRIEERLWELEGYKLQCELTNKPKLRIGVDVTNLDIHKEVLEVIQETIIDESLPKEYRENVVNRLGKVLGELQNKGVKKHSGPCTSPTADGPCEKCGN